ncbi:hypothetical protein C8Q77DRAFT_515550 [Trametes polyzona]|nr:hypothetical protein C8Q77DRAFT_515550 [Trametes polyzona]
MEDLRCVHYSKDLPSVIEVMKDYDDGFMNLALGPLHDNLRNSTKGAANETSHLVVLYRGNNLLLALTQVHLARAWQLICPQDAEHALTPPLLDFAAQQFATTLMKVVDPNAISSVYGYESAVNAFLKAWAALAQTKGTELRIADPLLVTRSSYATRESILGPPSPPPSFAITPGTEQDFPDLFPMYLDFLTVGPRPRALDVEEAALRGAITSGLMWVCRVEGYPAGYILHARVTPRTIAIRSVYVSPAHRRKGIAEGMVRAMSRYHLGARPVGYKGVPDDLPFTGVKDIICINVAEAAIERIYRRAGFLFPEYAEDGSPREARDPVTGLKSWFPSIWRGFQPQSAT